MNDAEQKAPQHGGHQLLLRVKPRIQPYFRQSDEIVPYDIDYVSEKASEHNSPKHCGNTAVHIHHNRFSLLPLRLAFKQNKQRCQKHYETVSRVRKHHTEEAVIEKCHNRIWVYIVLARKSVHFGYLFNRCGKIIIFKKHRFVFVVLGNIAYRYGNSKLLFKALDRFSQYRSGM